MQCASVRQLFLSIRWPLTLLLVSILMDSHMLNTTSSSVGLVSHPLVSRNPALLIIATLSYVLASSVVCMFRIVRMHLGIFL